MTDGEATDDPAGDLMDSVGSTCYSIQSLPAEVLELILRQVSPYEDLKNCRLVCRVWNKLVKDVVRWRVSGFVRDIRTMNVRWYHQAASSGPSIFPRYGHSCCRHDSSMFVFGGCPGRNTTFNDLWRFDLNNRCWIRPLAIGTYPPPMAFSTFVSYGNILVLFGGLAYPSPSILHQFNSYRLYNTLHFYDTQANQWSELTTITGPPHVAGHSATIHGHLMVVFGGRQFVDERYQCKSNDVWVLNLKTIVWWKQTSTDPKPPPMVNQTQIAIDDDHILIIDGCSGPKMILSDMWLLTLERKPDIPWTWTKMAVLNQQYAANSLWYHPACKVEDKLVFLGRGIRSVSSTPASMNQAAMVDISPRIWIPPRADDVLVINYENDADVYGNVDQHFQPHDNLRHHHDGPMQNGAGVNNILDIGGSRSKSELELCVNGRRGVLPHRGQSNINPTPSSNMDNDSSRPSCSSSTSFSSANVSGQEEDSREEVASCSSTNSINCNPIIDTCSLCGNPKLHSSKRRKVSLTGRAAEDSVKGADNDDGEVESTDWCHCSTTTTCESNLNPDVVAPKEDPPLNSLAEGYASAANSPLAIPIVVRNSAMPSVRPNSLKNRARQMESFQRMEQRIRNMMNPDRGSPSNGQAGPAAVAQPQPPTAPMQRLGPAFGQQNPQASSTRQPMYVHVLDISRAIERGELEWLPVNDQSASEGPEDTAFYSLVKGRGEIVMFGGFQKDLHRRNLGHLRARNLVSDDLYILSSK